MRVGIDGHMLGDRSGGNESYYTNILKNMIPTKDMELYLFVKNGVDVIEFSNIFRIVRFQETNAFKRNFIELPRLCKKYGIDLLHTQYFIPFFNPCPVVCTIHDICFEHYKNIFTKKEYYRQKLLIPYSARKSEFIYTVSENAKNDIVSHYGVDPSKVIVTYNSVNSNFKKLNNAELDESSLRTRFGLGNSRYILSVGNLQPRKNLPRLIKAYSKFLASNDEDIKLVIVGKKAWMFDDILKEACSDPEHILFTDYVTEKDLIRLYNAAHAFIYPSFFEGFGIPPLEAMACGTPVAVANATSLPEVVGTAGIYFDPFDEGDIQRAIYEIVYNDELRKRVLNNSSEQIKKFSWVKSANSIINSYSSIRK